MAGGKDQVVIPQIEGFHGPGHERKEKTVSIHRARQPLKEGSRNPAIFNYRRSAARSVNESEEVGVGKQATEGFEDFLSPAHPRQPIVDESDS
jgi:hypothetical protein